MLVLAERTTFALAFSMAGQQRVDAKTGIPAFHKHNPDLFPSAGLSMLSFPLLEGVSDGISVGAVASCVASVVILCLLEDNYKEI